MLLSGQLFEVGNYLKVGNYLREYGTWCRRYGMEIKNGILYQLTAPHTTFVTSKIYPLIFLALLDQNFFLVTMIYVIINIIDFSLNCTASKLTMYHHFCLRYRIRIFWTHFLHKWLNIWRKHMQFSILIQLFMLYRMVVLLSLYLWYYEFCILLFITYLQDFCYHWR